MPHVARCVARLLVVLVVLLCLPTGRATAGTDPGGAWPLSPRPSVVHGFDPPSSRYGAGHRGIDLVGAAAQPVLAALAGTVSFAGQLAGRGVVVVDHGTTRTTYEPLAASVRVGDVVSGGDPIGQLTSALSHCRPRVCLHLGWIDNAQDRYLDPMRLFGAAAVRLLPLDGSLPQPVATVVRLAVLSASGAGMGLLVGPP